MQSLSQSPRSRAELPQGFSPWGIFVPVVLISLLGVGLRLYAAPRLPINADEVIYFKAGWQYSEYMRQGDWKMLSWNDYNFEHPPLYKIIYGAALFTQPHLPKIWTKDFYDGPAMNKINDRQWGMAARYVSVIFGGLTLLVLALLNPAAGLIYAINTLAVQYNATIFLEALPTLASFLSALCYLRWYTRVYRKWRPAREEILWLGLSALLLGMAVASKYNYAVVGIVIVIHFASGVLLKENRAVDLWKLAGWGALALLFFYIFDPCLWKRPVAFLIKSLSFHLEHTKSARVNSGSLPFYQPMLWFFTPLSGMRASTVSSFLLNSDMLIGLLALAGLPRLFKRQPFYFIWLVTGMTVLLMWNTKWPQYTMTIMVPFCISASMGAGWLFDLLNNGAAARMNHQKKASPA